MLNETLGLCPSLDNFLNCPKQKLQIRGLIIHALRLGVFAPGMNGSSLGGELPLNPFFFGNVKEEELLEGEWKGFTNYCCFCV